MRHTLLAAATAIAFDSAVLWAQAPAEPLQAVPVASSPVTTLGTNTPGALYLGMRVNEVFNTGLVVGGVDASSPAEAAGLRAADVIRMANDQSVRTNLELGRVVSGLTASTPLRLRVARAGVLEEQVITINPTQRTGIRTATSAAAITTATTPAPVASGTPRNRGLGVTLAQTNRPGAMVTGLYAGSPAHQIQLPAYAVIVEFNGMGVNSPADLTNAVALTEPTRSVSIKYLDHGVLTERQVRLDPALPATSAQPTLAAVQPRFANNISSTTTTTHSDHTMQHVTRLEQRVAELERRSLEYDQRLNIQRR